MPKIPTLTTLRVEDFPSEQRQWLPRLFVPLNQFLTVVTNTLQGRVDFGANIPALDTALDFTYDGRDSSFTWNNVNAPRILMIGQSTEDGDVVPLTCAWVYNASNNLITATFYKLNGDTLSIGSRYKIFLRTVP